MGKGTGRVGLRFLCIQVLATLLRALPLKEDMEEWLTIGHLFSFLHQNNPEQVTLLLELRTKGVLGSKLRHRQRRCYW
jgi:hypothetical protein